MAYAALLSLSNTIQLILSYDGDSISAPAKDQIISIAESVNSLQAFLEDFPEEARRRFEAIIMAVTHEAEDIIEFFISSHIYEPRHASVEAESLEVFVSEAREGDTWINTSSGASKSKSNNQPRKRYKHLRCDFKELKEAKEEVESIAEKLMIFKNSITLNELKTSTSSSSTRVVASQKEAATVGMDVNLLHMKSILCGESKALEVVPVVGMGGIGKTMLARSVYDDDLIVQRFDVRVWVTVSQDYAIGEIVTSLLASLKVFAAAAAEDDEDEMTRRLLVFQSLKCRRFLIILDDIWNTDVWDELKLMFPEDGNGSRIMLTTRLQDVASYTDSSNLRHNMHFLNEDHSWNLLQQTVLKQGSYPIELEKIGKVIARRCRGLPLAIVVIAGILSSVDQTEATWKEIAENVKSTIYVDEEQIDKILSLSYVHLPLHLRTCFLYLTSFPEDYKIHASKLIKLWMAEGYLKPSGPKRSEEIGDEYLEDLVKRSLVMDIKRSSKGGIKSFSMHDLIREMCVKKGRVENVLSRFYNVIRIKPLFRSCENVRTTKYLQGGGMSEGLDRLLVSLSHYRLIRILDLLPDLRLPSDAYGMGSLSNLPSEICDLFHLRYLALSKIPAGILRLQNLQTFIIYSTWYSNDHAYNMEYVQFIMEIWSMPQLRHLHFDVGFVFCLPRFRERESFALKNLQTLALVTNFVCTLDIVETIPNVRKLSILYGGRDFEEHYQLNNLVYLEKLEDLKLEMHVDFPSPEKLKLTFLPPALKTLTLRGLKFPWEDLKVIGLLPNLQVLKLKSLICSVGTWETSEGEFSQLKHLLIDCTDLENWITESSHFPQLQCLVIYRCPLLSEIPDDIGEIPTLELIEVENRYESLVESAKQMQQNQLECGNDSLRVRIIKGLPIQRRRNW